MRPSPVTRSDRPAVVGVVLLALALLWPMLVAPPARSQPVVGGFDGDPATTERVAVGDPTAAALEVSRSRFGDAGGAGRQAAHAVVATVEAFADSLAGAALTTDGPLLLTGSAALADDTAAELTRVLTPGATVYVLGGEAALSAQVADDIAALGFTVARLAGATRVETALAVAEEVRRLSNSDTVLLARSEGSPGNPTSAWADSMTGGSLAAAARLPIVVTPTDTLHPAVAAWLAEVAPASTVLLGGEAALSDAVEDAAPNSRRLAGPERTATAAAIAAADLWPRGDARRFVILDGGREDGWAYGLSAAGLAADAGAPPLMVVGGVTASTRREVSTCGTPAVDLVLVGDDGVIGEDVREVLDGYDGDACASTRTALRSFASCTEALDFFVAEGLERVGPYGLDGHWYGAIDVDFIAEEDSAADGGAPPAQPAPAPTTGGEDADEGLAPEAGGDDDVSQTNVQEDGVDEPDTVKVTREAAYIASGGGVQVVALGQDGPDHLATIDVPDGAGSHELLLDDGVLLVLGRGDAFAHPTEPAPATTDFAPQPYYPEPVTTIARYDVSNPTAPQLLDTATIDGSYRSARMVEGTVRLVTSANPSGLHFVFPADGSQEAHDAALAHNRQQIIDSAIGDWLPQADGAPAVDCTDVFTPPGFSGMATVLVSTIDVDGGAAPTSSAAVVAQAETIYASTDRLVVSSSRWGSWTDELPEAVTTQLHSFDITDPAATTYVASGEVDGYVLNSFAISERDRYYRIATTTEPPFGQPVPLPEPIPVEGDGGDGATTEPAQPPSSRQADTTDNGITVLTEGGGELFEVGRVFGLGLGERIFAVRYLGDIAAVVTFRQVDPLYLVDLANPAAPRVTGELKIPGVSRYLHPLGEDHLLGVGQDGDDDGRLTGLQVSLFDISDRTDPTRVDSIEFGPGDSPVEHDHKAFLYWSPLDRALVPANLYGQDGREYSSAVQVIDTDVEAGTLTLAGDVAPPPVDGYPANVDRTFIADGVLYTLSYAGVSAHDLVTLADRGSTTFPGASGGCCVAVDEGAPPPDQG